MSVPFIDFSEQYKEIKDEIDASLKEVFQKSNFILGQPVKDFETAFAQYCQCKHGIGLNSGTDAIFLTLKAIGVGPGDEVIVPAFTFIATALGISYLGAKPVFVDIEVETHNLNPKKLESAITENTKAILPVHLYGQAADMKEIIEIASKHKIKVIEDACQAHGTIYQNKRIGSIGDAACFSFYPTKSLGGFGDGGMVVTNDDTIAEKIRMLRDYGREGRYEHKIIGFNSRLDTVQAVILATKLKSLDKWNRMRNTNATHYCELLKETEGIRTPVIKSDRTHVFQTFAVGVKNRDKVIEKMKEKEIGVLIHYPIPLHRQEAYQDLGYKKGDFPVAESFADETLSLPMFPHMTKEQIETVATALKDILKDG